MSHELNEKQQKAVRAPLGNTLVLAGAGSGKTRALVARIAWLVLEHKIPLQEILAVTFTNKAAGEMKTRLSTLLSTPTLGLWVGTFHGICHRILRRHYQAALLPVEFQILDSDDQARLIKRSIAALNLNPEEWAFKEIQTFINKNKDEGKRAKSISEHPFGPSATLIALYQEYELACQTAGLVDFAEILLRTLELFQNNPDILQEYQQRFKAILVDEFQDTNKIQYALIRSLAAKNTAVMVVGDDDQSIYGWRGAEVGNIHQFSHDFKNTTVIRLEQNYRSTSTILAAANALISHNNKRLGKELWTNGAIGEKIAVFAAMNELDEARYVSERISYAMREGEEARNMAILYRSNAQSRVLEEALMRMDIPYKIYGGLKFFERAEIKDCLAYLRVLTNPHDDIAFLRIVNFPTRGIGDKTLDNLRELASAHTCSLWQAAQIVLKQEALTARAALSLQKFMELIETLQQAILPLSLEKQIQQVIHASGLYEHFSKIKGDHTESKLANLQELVHAATEFRETALENTLPLLEFLAYTSLETGDLEKEEPASHVHLMTLHAAKGLEFQRIFLVGLEEGLFPSRQSYAEPSRMEEERRLCYVGLTRAKAHLTLSYAHIRRQYGREERHKPSRFLAELPKALLEEIRPKLGFKNRSLSTPESGLHLGQNVSHAKFGPGVVLSIEGSGAHTQVEVKFKEGVKWLVLAYANLT